MSHRASWEPPAGVVADWRRRVRRALRAGATTPFYLFAPGPAAERIARLDRLDFGWPVTHWLSFKTQPCAPWIRWWRKQGRPVEVVSEFELRAAIHEGYPAGRILVNGPAKHRWLGAIALDGLNVNFDSPAELAALLPVARRRRWRVGLRFNTAAEFDPGDPTAPTPFGFAPAEVAPAVRRLKRAGLRPEILHLHVRSNLESARVPSLALAEALAVAGAAGFQPTVVDVGGGLPPGGTADAAGHDFAAGFHLREFAASLRRVLAGAPGVRDLWLENGRFVTAPAGVLAVRVLDGRERRGVRQLVCDGGRTQHALVSTWEQHALHPLAPRGGRRVETGIHGPTCMAFDRLRRGPFPAAVRPGDVLLWFEAGAYHLPWETRFSHGLAAVWWDDESARPPVLARPAESFSAWWSDWR